MVIQAFVVRHKAEGRLKPWIRTTTPNLTHGYNPGTDKQSKYGVDEDRSQLHFEKLMRTEYDTTMFNIQPKMLGHALIVLVLLTVRLLYGIIALSSSRIVSGYYKTILILAIPIPCRFRFPCDRRTAHGDRVRNAC
jgi:hypothetical protein